MVVGYCRISTLEQKKNGNGIEIQVRDITLFAQAQGLFGTGLAALHAIEVRSRQVGAARVEVVAGLALVGDFGAGGDIGRRQNRAPVGRHVRDSPPPPPYRRGW